MKPYCRVVIISVVWLMACGSEPQEAEPPWRSGERVRARIAVAEDGFTIRTGWWDRELELDCVSFDSRAPLCGSVRVSDEPFFSDQACSRPALWLDGAGPNQGYAIQTSGSGVRLFRIPDLPILDFFVRDSGSCSPASGLDEVYPVLVELPLDELVAWQPATELGGGVVAYGTDDGALDVISVSGGTRVVENTLTRLRMVTEDDGRARAVVDILDTARDQSCRITATSDGNRCLPSPTIVPVSRYRDELCQDSVLASPMAGFGVVRQASIVSEVHAYQTLDPGPFYVLDGSSCSVDVQDAHYLGTAVPLAMFEAVTLAIE